MKLIVLFLCALALCQSVAAQDNNNWKHPEPISYGSLCKWHKDGGLSTYIWPKKHQIDLNGDGKDEVLLGIMGYSRGMVYALFTFAKGRWVMLSDAVEGSHHGYEVLAAEHHGWHDFKALTPSGRGGLFEFIYTWNGEKYVRKSEREIPQEKL